MRLGEKVEDKADVGFGWVVGVGGGVDERKEEKRRDDATDGSSVCSVPETLRIVIQRGLAWRMDRGQLDRDIES